MTYKKILFIAFIAISITSAFTPFSAQAKSCSEYMEAGPGIDEAACKGDKRCKWVTIKDEKSTDSPIGKCIDQNQKQCECEGSDCKQKWVKCPE